MRKYKNITALSLIALMLAVSSCKKDFLEIVPKGSLIAQNFEDYNLLMNGSAFYSFNGRGMFLPAALMGDDVSAEGGFIDNEGLAQAKSLFQWDADIFISIPNRYNTDNPLFLITLLSNMYTLNKIINEVSGSAGGTAQQKQEIQSEAMASRAFANFLLINYFAKPYSAETAATDPGFPIITNADITATNFNRGSVQEMYDFMVQDLVAAIPNLNTQPAYRTRWSKPAAEGFLGKVYLFMGKNQEALTMFKSAFEDIGKMSDPPRLYDYNVELAEGGAFQPIDPVYGPNTPYTGTSNMTESVIALTAYGGNDDGNNLGNDFLTISTSTRDLFKQTDQRLKLYTNLQPDQTPNPGGRLRRYTTPYSFYTRIGLELSELYLLKAESEARIGNLNDAKADVETFRKSRMPQADAVVPSATASDETALIKFIIDERVREFAALGYRWFDMRRLSVDPIFSNLSVAKHLVYRTSGEVTTFTLTSERLTLRIPQIYLKSNPGMVDNP